MRRPDPAGAERVVPRIILNLLPSTLSVGLDGEHLRLHVLDRRRPIVDKVRSAERHVARMLGLRQVA